MSYSASKSGVTLKTGLGFIQGHHISVVCGVELMQEGSHGNDYVFGHKYNAHNGAAATENSPYTDHVRPATAAAAAAQQFSDSCAFIGYSSQFIIS